MTLASLGPVVFDITTDLQKYDEESASAFARHDIFGGSPVYEDVGEEEGTFTFSGTMLPYLFGGLSGLAKLEAARLARVPLPLMRGDFSPMGWVLISKISKSSSELEPSVGVGQEISYTLTLIKVGTPGISSAADILRIFL
jgi:phage protein U